MKIDGEITLPGDKSISHRSLIFGALTSGTSKLFNLSDGEDVKSTISCLKDCNVKIVEKKNYTTDETYKENIFHNHFSFF